MWLVTVLSVVVEWCELVAVVVVVVVVGLLAELVPLVRPPMVVLDELADVRFIFIWLCLVLFNVATSLSALLPLLPGPCIDIRLALDNWY